MSLEVDVAYEDVDAVVTAKGPVDLATVPALQEAIDAQSEKARLVLVDLSAVTFLDSSGLRVLAQHHRRLVGDDGVPRLRLVVTSDPVGRLLDVSGLRSFFDVYASVDAARQGR